MCAKMDYCSDLTMERNGWRNSSVSSSSSTSSTTSSSSSWLERKFLSHFKRFFRRNPSSLTSDSTGSSRRPSSSTNDEIPASPIDEQPPLQVIQSNEDIPLLIPPPSPPTTPPIDYLYDYDRLLARCLERQEHDRTKLILRCQTQISIPHADLQLHQSRTTILNWKVYIRLFQNLSRDSHLFQQYINEWYSCQSSLNIREQLSLNIRTTQRTFDGILRKFLDDYVTCLTCQTAQTHLIKSNGHWRIECQLCGSQRTVKRLKWKQQQQQQ